MAAATLPAQSSVRLPDGVIEFEARRDGRVTIGAVGTVRMGVAAGAFASLALLTWLDQLDALAAAAGGADTVPLQSADGSLIILASAARAERDEPGLVLTFARGGTPAGRATALRLFLPLGAPADSAAPLVRLRAAATAAAATARTFTAPPAAIASTDGAAPPRPRSMPRPDRLFILGTAGIVGAIAGARLDGAAIGCEAYSCWRPGIEGLAVGGVVGYALGTAATRNRATCGGRRALTVGAAGAALGSVPGLVLASTSRPRLSLAAIAAGQAGGALLAGRWC